MEVRELVRLLRQTQFIDNREERLRVLGLTDIPDLTSKPILFKSELQKLKIPQGVPVSRTSGSTGTPVIVPKNKLSQLWYAGTIIRELMWRNWKNDSNHKLLTILARHKEDNTINGNTYIRKLAPIGVLQRHIDEIQPHYIFTYPSIIAQLDLSQQQNLIGVRTVGEIGATSYSCEEAGTIALKCPQNPQVYHIMEHIVVESDSQHGVLITDLTNPVITRYALGDIVDLASDSEHCKCGRKLPMITQIQGRIRNMLKLPNGDKVWPTVGEPQFTTITDKILRHQAVQSDINRVELHLKVSSKLTDEEHNQLLELVQQSLGYDHITVSIVYINGFKPGKFEAFKCLV